MNSPAILKTDEEDEDFGRALCWDDGCEACLATISTMTASVTPSECQCVHEGNVPSRNDICV